MKVVILGTGSTALNVVSSLLNDRNIEIVGFTDKDKKTKNKKIFGIEVIGSHDILKDLFKEGVKGAVVAIGYDNCLRERYFHQLKGIGYEMINVIHSSAIIDKSASLDNGVIIGPGCIISPMVKIEQNTILEAGVIIGPNTVIADNVYISAGCCINGYSLIRRNVFLSVGCSVVSYVTIGKNVSVAAGTSITKEIKDEIRKLKK